MITYRRESNGWAYEIRIHGRLIASGWCRGARRWAEADAQERLRQLGEVAA